MNLIANDLVIVKPMTSMTGYIQYLQFVAGTAKGGVPEGTFDADGKATAGLFNDPFRLGVMDESRTRYTSSIVVEPVAATDTECAISWTPVDGKVYGVAANGTKTELTVVNGKVTFVAGTYVKVTYQYDNIVIPQDKIPTLKAHMAGIALEAKA